MKQMKWILCVIVAGLALLGVAAFPPTGQTVYEQVRLHIEKDYIRQNLDRKELEYAAIQGYLGSLNDPYTRFLTPEAYSLFRATKEEVSSVGRSTVFRSRFGYIWLRDLDGDSLVEEFIGIVDKFVQKPIDGLILDLRFNGGGALRHAASLASLFMLSGDVVHVVQSDGFRDVKAVSGSPLYPKLPLIVIVNHQTASSAEILAAALQENNRAQVLGQDTFGKSSVQKIVDLPDGSGLIFTVGHYYTPMGRNLSQVGLKVDTYLGASSNVNALPTSTGYAYKHDRVLREVLDYFVSQLSLGKD